MNKPSGALLIGRQADPLEGCVDEVAIYGRALSAAEVGELYHEALKKLNPGIIPGQLVEPFEDLFGKTRGNPAPLPTLQHLPPADLTFVVITDTHIGEPTDEGMFCHNWRVEEAIRQINALRPDFVVLCGDIITTFPFRREQFERQCQNAVSILKKFTCPVRLVPGNHDIGNQRNMRVWDDKWLQQRQVTLEEMLFNPDYRALYIKYFGPDYYSFDAEGCQFIVFNAEICNSGGQLEQKQMQWLEQELKRAQGARASFLFMHNPLFWAEPEEPGPRNYEPVLQPARQQVLSLLERYPVTAVYSGHTHFGFENEYRGTHMRTINSTTFNRNYASIEQMMPFAAQIYDPHKLGYLVVRVRGAEVHESWTPLYWRVEALPGQLGQSGGRLVPRPASELADSVLGIRAQPPTTRLEQRSGQMAERMTDNELWWRLGENIGAKWVQTWPMPVSEADWQRMARGLSMDHPRGVTIALPMPAEANAMRETWQKLSQWAGGVDALIVCNGGPSDPKAPLSSWQVSGTPSEWANACRVARQLIGPAKKVVLARLSLLGPEAAELLKQTVAAARGAADAVAVWVTTQGPIESTVLPALQQAARTAREAEMELWLDTASWQTVSEPTRSANFLRLLAYCQMLGVRVFWWI
ncbi:MAG: metallophosphoesterase, partial [Armatimonadetes bacterium]|nr:metallophosphoesterase [Armatimonadota bacterium]